MSPLVQKRKMDQETPEIWSCNGKLPKKALKKISDINEKILIDGCHSETSAKNLANYLKTLKVPIYGIWAMTKNKDPDKFIKQFKGIFRKIITVPIENESAALSNKLLLKIAKKIIIIQKLLKILRKH